MLRVGGGFDAYLYQIRMSLTLAKIAAQVYEQPLIIILVLNIIIIDNITK